MKKNFNVQFWRNNPSPGMEFLFLDSSMVEHSAVNRVVVGSSPTRGVYKKFYILIIINSPSRTRTYDSAVNSRVLYRLSYRGKFPWRIAPSKLHIKYIISHLFCKVFSLHCLSMSFHPITFKDNSRSISLRFITNLTSSVKPSTY